VLNSKRFPELKTEHILGRVILKFFKPTILIFTALIAISGVGFESFGEQEKKIRVSPISMSWDDERKEFDTFFSVINDSDQDIEVTSIIIFKINSFRRWRGTRLPVIQANSERYFKISNSAAILLKNDYASITVNIYGKDYRGLIDYSYRHLKISSKRIVGNGETKVELSEVKKPVEGEKPEVINRLFTLGSEKEFPQLLKEKQFENAGLKLFPKGIIPKILLAENKIDRPIVEVKKEVVTPPVEKVESDKVIPPVAVTAETKVTTPPVEKVESDKVIPPVAVTAQPEATADVEEVVQPIAEIKKPEIPPLEAPAISVRPDKQKIIIQWQSVENATSYNLYWGTSAGLTLDQAEKIINVSSGFEHDQLSLSQPYYYKVTSLRDGEESLPSSEVSATPYVPPITPDEPIVTVGDTILTIEWRTVPGAESYNLYWSDSETTQRDRFQKLAGVVSGFKHPGLSNEATYTYYLTAENKGGESQGSPLVSANPRYRAPDPPLSVRATGELQAVTVEWEAVKEATSYNIYWSLNPGVKKSNGNKIENVASGYKHADLTSQTPLHYVVTAQRIDAEGAISSEVSATPLIRPDSPKNITVSSADGVVVINWDATENAQSYNMYWSTSESTPKDQFTKISAVESGFQHNDLENGVTHYYYVTSVNEAGESQESPIVASTPQVSLPDPPVLSAITGNESVKLQWSPVAGAEQYHLYWSTTPGVSKLNGTKIPDVKNGLIVTSLQNGTAYYYILTSANPGGESVASKEVSATPQISPAAPPVLSGKVGDSKITLSWEEVPTAASYNLYWSKSPSVEKEASTIIVDVQSGFEHTGLQNNQAYYYKIASVNAGGEGAVSQELSAIPKIPAVIETPVSELLENAYVDDFVTTSTAVEPELLIDIQDDKKAKEETLKRAKDLETLDISSREKLIALYIAEGKSDSIAEALSGQLTKQPKNLNLSLSLSKVYHEQGDITAALDVLTTSLNRISLSARVALNQELKTGVKKGQSTLTQKSDEAYLADEFSRLGVNLLERKKYLEALSAFQSLYSLAQDYPMVKYYMGMSRKGMKQYNQAKQLFVEQSQEDIAKKQLLSDLAALVDVLASTMDIPVILSTKKRYEALLEEENEPKDEDEIKNKIVMLEGLHAEAEKKRLEGLSDLGIALAKKLQLKNIQPGQDIYFDLVATNLGKKDSKEFKAYYQIKHQQGAVYDIAAADRFQPLKANNQSQSWNKKISVPNTAIPGMYQLIVNIEQVDAVGEVTLENNQLVSGYDIGVVPPKSDLKLEFTKLVEQKTINPSEKLLVGFLVVNKGYKKSSKFNVSYFLKHEDGTQINFNSRDSFGAIDKGGKSTSWEKPLVIPDSLKKGNYQIFAQIELDKAAKDQNLENNQISSAFSLSFTPSFLDLAVSIDKKPVLQTVGEDKQIQTAFALSNLGNTKSARIGVTYELKDRQGNSYPLPEEDNFDSIESKKEPVRWDKILKISQQIPSGRYQLVASLKAAEPNLDKNRSNDTAASDFIFDIGPKGATPEAIPLEVAFSDPLQQQEVTPGGNIEIELKLFNKGNKQAGPLSLKYSLREAGGDIISLPPSDTFESLPPGDLGTSFKKMFDIPSDLKPGNYQFIVEMGPDTPNQADNVEVIRLESAKGILLVPETADISIQIQKEFSPRELRWEEGLEGKILLEYEGNVASANFVITYQLKSASGKIYLISGSDEFSGFAPKQPPISLLKTFLISKKIPGGSYTLQASIETKDGRSDTNFENNVVVVTEQLKVIPELASQQVVEPEWEFVYRAKFGAYLPAGNRDEGSLSNVELGFSNSVNLGVLVGVRYDDKWETSAREAYINFQFRPYQGVAAVGIIHTSRLNDIALKEKETGQVDGASEDVSQFVPTVSETDFYVTAAFPMENNATYLQFYFGMISQSFILQHFLEDPAVALSAELYRRRDFMILDRPTDTIANEDKSEREEQAMKIQTDLILSLEFTNLRMFNGIFAGNSSVSQGSIFIPKLRYSVQQETLELSTTSYF
jgi:fibronectin type 3 domain-containing protein